MRKSLGLLVVLSGCGGVDSSGVDPSSLSSSGQLLVSMSASTQGPLPVSDLASIIVNVEQVRVHGPGGWQTIATGPVEVDLLALDEAEFEIAWTELEPGQYKNVRLVLVDDAPASVTLANGETHALKTPSGQQSGLKLKGDFTVEPCHTTVLDLNFDVPNSLHVHGPGHGRNMMLRPVIRTNSHVVAIEDCNPDGEPAPPGEGGESETGDPTMVPDPSTDPLDRTEPDPNTDPGNDTGIPDL